MATALYIHESKLNGISTYRDMTSAAGSSVTTGVVDTVASGTEIQWTKTSAGELLTFISGRFPVGGATISGQMTFSFWAQESNMNANCGIRVRVFKRTEAGTETEMGSGWAYGTPTELSFSAATEYVWNGTPPSTSFAENDRLMIKVYIINVGTMASGYTCTLTYDAASGSTGDSFFQIDETITFKSEAQSFQEGFTLSASGGLTAARLATLQPAMALGAGGGISAAGSRNSIVAITLGAQGGIGAGGGIAKEGLVTLGVSGGFEAAALRALMEAISAGVSLNLAAAAGLDAQSGLTLNTVGGIGLDGALIIPATVTLPVSGGLSADVTAQFQGALALAVTLSILAGSRLDAQATAVLAAALQILAEGAVAGGGNVYNETVTFAVQAALTGAVRIDAEAILLLATQTVLSASPQMNAYTTALLAVQASLLTGSAFSGDAAIALATSLGFDVEPDPSTAGLYVIRVKAEYDISQSFRADY